MIMSSWFCIIIWCRLNDSVRGMYEHVKGILKHKHKYELVRNETYLPLLKLIQLNSTQEWDMGRCSCGSSRVFTKNLILARYVSFHSDDYIHPHANHEFRYHVRSWNLCIKVLDEFSWSSIFQFYCWSLMSSWCKSIEFEVCPWGYLCRFCLIMLGIWI